ncbi:MAG: NADH-quinone oxidoreductase subunit C [Phycisphaerales bacterium]|nr:NADH-quinone oxidoreductase subunit C [Phycisphaerales bacterium]
MANHQAPTPEGKLTPAQIVEILTEKLGDSAIEAHMDDSHPRIHIQDAQWRDLAEFVYNDPRLKFDWLSCITSLDYVADEKLACCYDLMSYEHRHEFAVKVFTDRENPSIPSVADIWPAADWHEREAYDLMGIDFPGHPDLRRILLPEDWEGHPLRKDYVFPREYHSIPASYEMDWQQKPTYPG